MKALVRPPTPSFVEALGQVQGNAPIAWELAIAQHEAYARALTALGCDVTRLSPEPDLPDACFVEDTAIVLGDSALITWPGALSRRGEIGAVAAALSDSGLALTHMEAPATLDGGDVLVLGRTVWVGRSARTNREGIETLAAFARRHGYDTREAEVPGGILHLKCHASPLDEETLLCAPGWLVGAGARRIEVPAAEAYAANAVAIGRTVLCASGYPRTAELLAAAGFEPLPLDNSEFGKADGSLTCLSILWG